MLMLLENNLSGFVPWMSRDTAVERGAMESLVWVVPLSTRSLLGLGMLILLDQSLNAAGKRKKIISSMFKYFLVVRL
jgi:hypothetical protein